MAVRGQAEEQYVKRVYRRTIALAMAAHLTYVVIFTLLKVHAAAIYNVASVLFYLGMQVAINRGHYKLAVTSIHLEVCVFATVCTLAVGWESGIGLYLLAMTSLTYFCPYRHKQIPFVFAVGEVCLFLGLRIYTGLACPGYLAVSETAGLWLCGYSICAGGTFILYAAFSSKVSAAVSQRELQAENRSLTALANYDQLTGFLNRRAFLAKLAEARGEQASLVLGDIDDFKTVNDTWGHICGDWVLSECAELVRGRLGASADICRWGGEEFVFLFRGMALEDVLKAVQDLRHTIETHPFCYNGEKLHITMTFGVSPDAKGITAEELVARADQQMYTGKARGKNQVVCKER